MLIASARKLFAKRGYAQTTTRAIADEAGVAEPLIFRHFSNKAVLFEQAVFVPFEDLLSDYMALWAHRTKVSEDVEARARRYVETLFDRLHADRQLWRALILSLQADSDELGTLLHGPQSPLVRYLEKMGKVAHRSMTEVGWNGVDARVAIRITFGYIFTFTVFDDLLYAKGQAPRRQHLIDEMAAYMVHGIAHRAPTGKHLPSTR